MTSASLDVRASTIPSVHVSVAAFEGPLDLLLHLIRANKIDIYDIPLAQIAQQYVDAITELSLLDLAQAGEYLVMAATLVEIKARMLLPQVPSVDEDPVDPREELVERLLEYEKYRGMVELFRLWEEERRTLYFREAAANPDDYMFAAPAGLIDGAALSTALSRVLERAGVDTRPVTTVTSKRRLNVRFRMAEIMRRLREFPDGLPFDDLLPAELTKFGVVLTFLALLELVRTGHVWAKQNDSTQEILVGAQCEREQP